jgi:mRNA interferase RelE/StbE
VADIRFTAAAVDDLRRIGPSAVPYVLKKVLLLDVNVEAGHPLGGALTGFRKLVVGRNTWRVVYRLVDQAIEICEIRAIGARADAEVYDEALARLRAAGSTRPEFIQLAKVIEQLGTLAGDVVFDQAEPRLPVPDWLADRLVFTAGMSREAVAALDLKQAVDLWSAFASTPREL